MRFIEYKGPRLEDVLKGIISRAETMADATMDQSAMYLEKQVKEDSPVKSGRFKKSIRRSGSMKKRKQGSSQTIGIQLGSKAQLYGMKVERKYKVFRTVELRERNKINKMFSKGLNSFWNRQRIK